MSNQYDLSYRPETYWPESLDREQLLARIQGEARRNIVREALCKGDIGGLDPVLAAEQLDEENRRAWGLVHPALMGGEYLPSLGAGNVEIARISLASVTSDQISIRAGRDGSHISYSVCDEYGSNFKPAIATSEMPLTLAELVHMIDETCIPGDSSAGGLFISHWNHALECGDAPEAAVRFASIQSAWYPELEDYYEDIASSWCAEIKEARGVYDDEEGYA